MPSTLGIIASAHTEATGGGEFAPDDIAGLALWLDASDTASITHSSGAVSQWNDLSGNGRHFVQATGANQPITGSVTVNSLNAIDFDGSNDRLALSTPISTATDNVTMFVACQPDGAPGGASIPFYNGRPGFDGYGPCVRTNSTTVGWLRGGVQFYNGTSSPPSSGVHLFSLMRTSGSVSMRYDTVEEVTGTEPFPTPTVEAVVGMGDFGSAYFNGAICECLFYTAALGATDRQAVEGYFAAKWGTP